MSPKSNLKWYVIIFTLLVLLAVSVFWTFLKASPFGKPENSLSQPLDNSSLYDSQNAIFTGKITKVDGEKIWLENKRGVTGEAVLAQNFTFMDMSDGAIATPSSDIKKIPLNKEAIISFNVVGDQYQAVSISFLPELEVITTNQAPPMPLLELPDTDSKILPPPPSSPSGKIASPKP